MQSKTNVLLFIEKWGPMAIAAIITFFSPIVPIFMFVGFLVMCDWITGIMKAKKTKTFTSTHAIRKFWVSSGYFFGILICRMVEMYINQDMLVKPMVAIIAIAEIQSLRENIKELSGLDLLKPISNLFKK